MTLLLTLGLAACTAGPPTGSGDPEVDAGPPADAAPPPIDAAVEPDATPACIEPAPPEATRHHPAGYEYSEAGAAGAGCLGQCHNGVLGPQFTVGGSLWDRRLSGGSPIAGATVVVVDANDKVVEMVTNLDGQFWSRASLQAPIRTFASSCPEVVPMIANATGNCSSGACHGENAKVSLVPLAQ